MTLPLFAAILTCLIEGRRRLAPVKVIQESAESRRFEMIAGRIFLAFTFDANGALIFNRCTTIRGSRIKIEPLAEQCQNITPPQ